MSDKRTRQSRKPPENEFLRFFYELFTKKKVAAFGFVIVVLCLLVAIFADVIAPYKMVNGALQGSILDKLQPPSKDHWFGTDTIGRDVFSYIIYGTRTTVVIAVSCTIISVVEAVIIGVSSVMIGGWFDLIVQRIVDAWMCIPAMLISLVLMCALGSGIPQLILVLSVPSGIVQSRMFRSMAVTVKDARYVDMSKMLGSGLGWRMRKHIIPNIMPLVLMILASSLGGVIMMEASLSFLGFGVSPSTPDWGAMLTSSGRSNMYMAPWLALIPGIAIALLVFATAMLGDGVRDILDPRLRGGVANYRLKNRRSGRREADTEA